MCSAPPGESQVSQEFNLGLSRSLLIGDRLSDLEAGSRAGLTWLVLSGDGVEERAAVEQWDTEASSDNHICELTLLTSLLEFPCHRLQRTA